MAKINGPLLSVKASGTIGPRLTFSVRKSGQQARFQRAQKDRITPNRTLQRAKFLLGLTMWRLLPPDEKYYWTIVESKGEVYI